MYQLTADNAIRLQLDNGGAMFLPATNNGTPEWREYQAWLDAVNTPDPAPEPLPPLTTPKWVQFADALATNPTVNTLVAAASTQFPVLHLMLGVGLGQAAQGDTQTFLAAWSKAVGLGLVTAEVATDVATVGETFDLPADFLAAINPSSDQPN